MTPPELRTAPLSPPAAQQPEEPAALQLRAAIGAEIRTMRRAKRLPVRVVAKLLGQGDAKKVYRWETGERVPGFPIMHKLARIYGCRPGDLSPTWTALLDRQLAVCADELEKWKKRDPGFRNAPHGRNPNWFLEQGRKPPDGTS